MHIELFNKKSIKIKSCKTSAPQLSNTIAIKGGTTEAGLNIMKKNNINKIFSNVILTAYKRANFLGKKK